MNSSDAWRRYCAVLLLAGCVVLAGCAARTQKPPEPDLFGAGTPEEGLARMAAVSRAAPGDRELRIRYLNARAAVVGRLLAEGHHERQSGRFDAAEALFRRVLAVEAENALASEGLLAVERDRRHAALIAGAAADMVAGDIDAAERKLAEVLQDDPRHPEALALRRQLDDRGGRNAPFSPALRKELKKPVTLEFRDTPLRQVLEALSKHTGLNFVLDKNVPPDATVTVFLRRVSVADALDVLLGSSQLRRRVLNDTTVLIYPDTADKLVEHQELVVKNFFLANADAKQVAAMLKTILKAKNVFSDDKLNLLIVRDTPETIRLVERMVAVHDVPEPEVMLELEVLEIQRSKLWNLGIQWPEQLTLFPLPSVGTTLTLRDLDRLSASRVGATLSDTVINLRDILNNANLLANPRIRTHSREKALIRIGDRVPVITTTATSTGFVSENVQYIDVGLKLEVEPTIFPDDEISLKLALEVSSVTRQIVSSSGTTTYQIGGRNAATVLRLKDGETQILGGLINDQDVDAANRVPGLASLPMLGRLFRSVNNRNDKTELLLSVTPRLVRGLSPPARTPTEFWSGTENNPRLNSLAFAKTVEKPAAPPAAAAGPALPALAWEAPPSVRAGERVRLSLRLASREALAALPLTVAWDRAVFELIDDRPGNFMAQGNGTVETTRRLDADAGVLSVVQQRQAKKGAQGDGEVLQLEFQALKPAPASRIEARSAASGVGASLPPPAVMRLDVLP